MKCQCSSELRIEKRSLYQDTEILDNLYFDNFTVEVCDNCGNEIKCYYKMNKLYRTIAQATVLQPWVLRGQDIKFLRIERAIKSKDWAGMLTLDLDILSCLEKNELPISLQLDTTIRLLYCRIFEEREKQLFPYPITINLPNKRINQETLAICINMEEPAKFTYKPVNSLCMRIIKLRTRMAISALFSI